MEACSKALEAGIEMYRVVRVWQLKPGCSAADLETLTATGIVEMQRWVPGVKHLSLLRLQDEPTGRYLFSVGFTDERAYRKWRQVEEEGPDYWERYASVQAHWEQLSSLVEEYVGAMVIDVQIGEDAVQDQAPISS